MGPSCIDCNNSHKIDHNFLYRYHGAPQLPWSISPKMSLVLWAPLPAPHCWHPLLCTPCPLLGWFHATSITWLHAHCWLHTATIAISSDVLMSAFCSATHRWLHPLAPAPKDIGNNASSDNGISVTLHDATCQPATMQPRSYLQG